MIDTNFKVKKVETVNANGVVTKKFVPIRRTTIFGIGFWKECKEWSGVEKQIADDKFLGMDTDSTLTHIREFIDAHDDAPKNEYYNE